MSEARRTCPECGGAMVHETRQIPLSYKGLTERAAMEGDYCLACGEGVHTGSDLDESDQALNRMKARVQGLLLPDEIKRIRKKLNLTLRAAGERLGGGKNAFYKYERGELLPSAALSNLLKILDVNPDAVQSLLPSRAGVFPVDENDPAAAKYPKRGRRLRRDGVTEKVEVTA